MLGKTTKEENMIRTTIFVLFIAICVGSTGTAARAEDSHTHHGHDVSGPELGISAGYVRLVEDDEDVLGVHAHLMVRLGDEGFRRYLAIGVGGEYLFAKDQHYALMLSLAAFPWRGLVLSLSPGVQWAEHGGETEAEYSTHLEATYVFALGQFDMGPVIDYSRTKDEAHYMVGLHVGMHL